MPALAFVIAHYHPAGRVPVNLLGLVRRMRRLTSRIVFVSTGITDEEAARVAPFAQVIVRENIGYDFWSYRVGIEALGDLAGIDRLVILNSSFITLFPKRLLAQFTADLGEPGLRGLTACRHPLPHLQSYCIMFETQELLRSDTFRRWWADMVPLSNRADVVEKQELGMAVHFGKAGVPMVPIFQPDPNDLAKAVCRLIAGASPSVKVPNISSDGLGVMLKLSRGHKLNPTHFMWDSLIIGLGILKVELPRDNPMNLGLEHLRTLLTKRPKLGRLVDDALEGDIVRDPRRKAALHMVSLQDMGEGTEGDEGEAD